MALAAPGSYIFLVGISALAEDDAWVVGYYYDAAESHSLALHWDGDLWAFVATPTSSPEVGALGEVVALAPDNVWAVGRKGPNSPLISTGTG